MQRNYFRNLFQRKPHRGCPHDERKFRDAEDVIMLHFCPCRDNCLLNTWNFLFSSHVFSSWIKTSKFFLFFFHFLVRLSAVLPIDLVRLEGTTSPEMTSRELVILWIRVFRSAEYENVVCSRTCRREMLAILLPW